MGQDHPIVQAFFACCAPQNTPSHVTYGTNTDYDADDYLWRNIHLICLLQAHIKGAIQRVKYKKMCGLARDEEKHFKVSDLL